MPQADGPPSARSRLAKELRDYLALSLYFLVCLGAILLYRAALLEDHGIGRYQVGTAIVKALVLAKFVMLGRIGGVGEGSPERPLLPAVLRGSIAVLLVLVALTVVEDLAISALHGGRREGALADLAGGRWPELAASALLMWLVLIPYLAFQHLYRALGSERTRRLLLGDRRGTRG